MQGWLRWINYINPIAYAYETLMANELSKRQFPCAQFIPMGPPYANATSLERTCSVSGAAPGLGFVDGDVFMNSAFGYYHDHIWRYASRATLMGTDAGVPVPLTSCW